MPPLLGGKGTAHAGSTWVTYQIREKNYGYRTPSKSLGATAPRSQSEGGPRYPGVEDEFKIAVQEEEEEEEEGLLTNNE